MEKEKETIQDVLMDALGRIAEIKTEEYEDIDLCVDLVTGIMFDLVQIMDGKEEREDEEFDEELGDVI